MNKPKIPFWIAVIINLNIVIGSAFFLGAPQISTVGGLFAPVAWLICGLMLLPLVIVLSRLAKIHPTAGGIYVYSRRQLGEFWGFFSGWGYFVGTVAGNAAVIHAFSKKFQTLPYIEPYISAIGLTGLSFDVVLVLLFAFFNLLNVEFLERAQVTFTILKSIPFFLLLIAAPFLFDLSKVAHVRLDVPDLLGIIPFVLFAYIGIEACCAITDQIEGGTKSGSRAILISFAIIMSVYAFFQFMLVCVGDGSANPFLAVLPRLTNNQVLINVGNNIVYFAILSSFLGGFYGMFYYNNWNLYAMAKEGNVPFSGVLTKLNKNGIPWVSVFTQSALVIGLLLILQKGAYLVTVSDFGVMGAYLLSALAFLTISRGFVAIASLVSCLALSAICLYNLVESGIWYLAPFVIVMAAGIVMFYLHRRLEKRNPKF